jgi:S-DNA-T family DNA segregation ATPase FtsK/SpoIIIE
VPQNVPGRGLSPQSLHFLAALPRSDGRDGVEDLNEAARGTVTAIREAWRGQPAPPVRLLPDLLPYEEIQSAPGTPIGIGEADLAPVSVDFDADPHFLVFGDNSCGKSNLLRLFAKGITGQSPEAARMIIVDYRRSLLDLVDTEHVVGYAPSATAAQSLVTDLVGAMRQRLPGPDVTPEQLRTRGWWAGSDVYLLVDDYDLVVTPSGNPLLALLEVLPQSRDIGLHVILARSVGGAGRALYEPFLQRLRELGSPGLVMSGSRDEGALIGDVMAQRLPAGRGVFVSRRMSERTQVQTAYLPPA